MKTQVAKILEGPADCGNVFGYFKPGLVPAGKFAIVKLGTYTNGGSGPCAVNSHLYGSMGEARAALADYLGPQWCSEATPQLD